MTGSPSVTANPSLGIATLSENALAVMRWQPVQWQAMERSGGALTAGCSLQAQQRGDRC
jgi:hypothetical protein